MLMLRRGFPEPKAMLSAAFFKNRRFLIKLAGMSLDACSGASLPTVRVNEGRGSVYKIHRGICVESGLLDARLNILFFYPSQTGWNP